MFGYEWRGHAAGHARAAGCEWPHVDLADHLEPFYLDTCGFRPRKAGLIALRAGRHGRPAMVVTRSGTWRTRMPSTVRDALAALAALLAPGEHDVADRVTSAHDDPEAYLRAHADQLDERGVDEPVPTLAWIALVDALADRDLLAEVDWKEDPREVVDRLRTLRSTPANAGAWIWLEDTDIHVATHDFLELAGTRLREAGTALAVLDIESDCYPLVLLPAGRGRDLVDLATAAGFTADVLGAARS